MSRCGQYNPLGVILNPEHSKTTPCALCGEGDAYESHYGTELGLCCRCAEAAANLWWKAHSGEYLTWPDAKRPKRGAQPVPQAVKWQVLRGAGFRCATCGAEDQPMHVDHIVPRSRGGGNEIENLQALCAGCNIRKGAK